MQKLAPEEWKQLFAWLDTALELSASEREAWLANLDAGELKGQLRELLTKHTSGTTDPRLDALPRFTIVGQNATNLNGAGPTAGDTVGPYKLLREIGRGGMGSVWLAERADGAFHRKVALKLPHVTWLGRLAERMARERDILASLEHPHIARLYDAGVDELGRPFMAMEFVEGQPIDEYCRNRNLPIPDRLRLILEVAKAVAYAHSRLIVHRDLKPANILVSADGSPHLLDFGVAKLLAAGATGETQFVERALTPDYASPEQLLGAPIGTASDVYSLAVIAYELLTGARPYKLRTANTTELEAAILAADVPLASDSASERATRRQLRGDVDAILNRALKKDVEDRYATVDAFARDIDNHLRGLPVQARPDSTTYRIHRFVARHKSATFATIAVIVAVIAGTSVAVWQAREARAQAERTALERDVARRAAAREEAVRLHLTRLFRASVAERGPESPSAKTMLDRSASRVLKEYRDDPYLAGKVVETLADLYTALGDMEGQVPLLEGFLAQAGAEADAQALALVQQKLASVELVRGNAQRAAELLSPAEEFWKRDPTRFAEQRLEGLGVRARLQRAQGDIPSSIVTSEEAIRARIELSGRDHAETANLYNSLAIALTSVNRWDKALKAYEEALDIHAALGRADDLDALIMRANIGTLSYRYGRIREAESHLKTAFEGQRALAGDSAAVAAAMGMYGSLQSLREQHAIASQTLATALDMAIKFAGPNSPVTMQTRVFVADAQVAANNAPSAKRMLAETLSQAAQQFGPAHPFVQRVKVSQARIALFERDYSTADKLLTEAVAMLRVPGPPTQLALSQALVAQGELLLATERTNDAIPALTESVQIREALLAPESWELAEARARLGEALRRIEPAQSERLLAAAVRMLEAQLGGSHPQTLRARDAALRD